MLQRLILFLVRQNPDITEGQVLHIMHKVAGRRGSLIVSIDTESGILLGDTRSIHFEDREGNPKTASVNGLKDRLSRAKKQFALTG